MANFDSGVKRYIIGTCQIKVGFPVDNRDRADVSCNQCRFYSRSTKSCKLNNQLCYYPETHIGAYCPLTFESEGEVE